MRGAVNPDHSPIEPGPARCGNCESPLAGPWCSQCGQHAHESARGIGALLHDAWHSLTHLDGRVGQTLRLLLLQPGALTAEYFANRRARFAPPFRLYLICSLVFFALASITTPATTPEQPVLVVGDAKDTATSCAAVQWNGQPPPAWLLHACQRIASDNGAGLGHAFLANAPKMMFVLLPLVALVMLPFWWRPRRWYVEHLVFSLHTHTFVFATFSLLVVLNAVGERWLSLDSLTQWLSVPLWVWMLAYPWLAMRRYYGQSRWRTTLKFMALACLYGCLLTAAVAGNVVLSALTL